MTQVMVVGGGAVAQLICRDLVANGSSAQLTVPARGHSEQWHRHQVAKLATLPWLEGVQIRDEPAETTLINAGPEALRIFAGTVEQWLDYQNSPAHRSADEPVLLLTSWWKTLSNLQEQLKGSVLPVYPRTTVESWMGRLAVVGGLQLELPSEALPPGLDRVVLQRRLDQLGLSWVERPMQGRFRALFARTRFAYWYVLDCLEPRRGGATGQSRETIIQQWRQIEHLLEGEADLAISLEMLELGLALLRNGDPDRNNASWILHVLLNHKRRKMEYFLQRQENRA